MTFWLGIDCGTSGLRCCVIDEDFQPVFEQAFVFEAVEPSASPPQWQQALFNCLAALPLDLRKSLQAIAIDATSGTLLLCDVAGKPLSAPLMYDDTRGQGVLTHFLAKRSDVVPEHHVVRSASSTLTKALWLAQQPEWSAARHLLHQADWLAAQLHGQWGFSDYHNALKLGIDPQTCTYPDWFPTSIQPLAPRVVAPGTPLGTLQAHLAETFGINPRCIVCAGTTDSLAAFMAAGAQNLGDGVTSLGSTLAIKLLSDQPITDSKAGIYSHRYGDLWLVGGASNSGGAVLAHFFSPAELAQLSQHIDPHQVSPYRYIPLLKPGERFPVNDPNLKPCLEPRPTNDVEFLHGLLESIARIEAQGYQRLIELSAPKLKQVWTMGGGAQNSAWTLIRHRYLGVPLKQPHSNAAAYGAALLAYRQGITES